MLLKVRKENHERIFEIINMLTLTIVKFYNSYYFVNSIALVTIKMREKISKNHSTDHFK